MWRRISWLQPGRLSLIDHVTWSTKPNLILMVTKPNHDRVTARSICVLMAARPPNLRFSKPNLIVLGTKPNLAPLPVRGLQQICLYHIFSVPAKPIQFSARAKPICFSWIAKPNLISALTKSNLFCAKSKPNLVLVIQPTGQRHLCTSLCCMASKTPKKKTSTDEDSTDEKLLRRSKNSVSTKYNKIKKVLSVDVWDSMSLADLAEQSGRPLDDLSEFVFSLKEIDTDYIRSEHQPLNNRRLISLIGTKLHFKLNVIADPKRGEKKSVVNKDEVKSPPPDPKDLVGRPPVVTIMGHIDHGKTSLLDYLRQSRIVAGEHGGITQHIGAFSVTLDNGQSVTFIDTPGHAAFTAMRTRGANTTDIVVLIVDACEGVLPQTKESLRIIREARVPFVVALNKIDKPEANIDFTKQQLEADGVRLEEKGGDVQCVPISALKGTNVQQLVEAVLTLAEVLELRCDVKGRPEGTVIESQVEQGLGKTTTILLNRGILKLSDFLVGEQAWCKVRLLLDDRGHRMDQLLPGQAAKVVGWREDLPSAGSEVLAVESEARAKEVVAWRKHHELQEQAVLEMDSIEERRKADRERYEEFRRKKREFGWFRPRFGISWHQRPKETVGENTTPAVPLIIKGDVDGSVEAILSCLDTYTSQEVLLDIVHFGVGQVTESDVALAQRFNAIIYTFNTLIPPTLQKAAQAAKVPVRPYNVIYHLIDDLKQEISLRLPPANVEDVEGRANVLQEFLINVSRKQQVPVAGCRVVAGRLPRKGSVRIIRNNSIIYEGELASLKHLKEEVNDVQQGQECGLRLKDDEIRFEAGDQIVAFTTRLEPRVTDWDPGF